MITVTNSQIPTVAVEVRQRAVLEAVRDAVPADGLLTDAGDHLRDVDERALRAAHRHRQRAVALVQLAQTRLARVLADQRQLLQHHRLRARVSHHHKVKVNVCSKN